MRNVIEVHSQSSLEFSSHISLEMCLVTRLIHSPIVLYESVAFRRKKFICNMLRGSTKERIFFSFSFFVQFLRTVLYDKGEREQASEAKIIFSFIPFFISYQKGKEKNVQFNIYREAIKRIVPTCYEYQKRFH